MLLKSWPPPRVAYLPLWRGYNVVAQPIDKEKK